METRAWGMSQWMSPGAQLASSHWRGRKESKEHDESLQISKFFILQELVLKETLGSVWIKICQPKSQVLSFYISMIHENWQTAVMNTQLHDYLRPSWNFQPIGLCCIITSKCSSQALCQAPPKTTGNKALISYWPRLLTPFKSQTFY